MNHPLNSDDPWPWISPYITGRGRPAPLSNISPKPRYFAPIFRCLWAATLLSRGGTGFRQNNEFGILWGIFILAGKFILKNFCRLLGATPPPISRPQSVFLPRLIRLTAKKFCLFMFRALKFVV
jgi:hypothetical protein